MAESSDMGSAFIKIEDKFEKRFGSTTGVIQCPTYAIRSVASPRRSLSHIASKTPSSRAFKRVRQSPKRMRRSGSVSGNSSPSSREANSTPASSKHSRMHATQYARPPRSIPSTSLARVSSSPFANSSQRSAWSAPSTLPPGKTCSPPNIPTLLRSIRNTSMPSRPSRTRMTVAEGLGVAGGEGETVSGI